jgi:hypothetical protein
MPIRAFAMLDHRLGKRRLRTMDLSGEPHLVRAMYPLRCEAEQVERSVAAA